jgi:subtilisin family serine protease
MRISWTRSRRQPWRVRPWLRRVQLVSGAGLLIASVWVQGLATAGTAEPANSKVPVALTDKSTSAESRIHPTAEQRAAHGESGERLGGVGLAARSFSAQRRVVIVDDQNTLDAAIAAIDITPIDVWSAALFGFVADLSVDQATKLRAMAGVTAVEPDRMVQASVDQTNPPWNLDRIDQSNLPLDNTYTYSRTGAGVTAYVIDSGVWLSHTEFTDRTAPGAFWDFGDGYEEWDCSGHGTHVAGTVGGTTYGVAKQVTIVSVRVLDCDGSGPISAIAAGIDWVTANHAAGVPAVANLSLGMVASSSSLVVETAVGGLIADGVTVVASAGNDGAPSCSYTPGRMPDVITVAASDANDDDAEFSNYGACNDLFAPGVNVLSAYPSATNMDVIYKSGTSMAAPHVTGAAALVLEGSPSAAPAQVWAELEAATTKGVLTECCDDPDKLLRVGPQVAPGFASLTPARVLETRAGLQTIDGQFAGIGPRAGGSTLELRVAGRAGVPADATAVMLNLTAVNPAGPGYLTVYPCGQTQPLASNVNYLAGDVVPNAALAKLGTNGNVCIFTLATTDIIIDVNGYVPAGGTTN